MTDSLPPVLRYWDGKSKVATIWTDHTTELDLCPPGANCHVYISDDESQYRKPSFSIFFDMLVTRQCQPLMKILVFHSPNLDHGQDASLPTRDPQNLRVRSTCSLTLKPPTSDDEHEVRQYNVTTRNFFAWILGRPIVGLDPASALMALKIRMDVWRASSCDNTAAVYEYAKAQSYGELGDLQLFMANHLRGVPSIPRGYSLLPLGDTGSLYKLRKRHSLSFRRLWRSRAAALMAARRRESAPRSGSLFQYERSSPSDATARQLPPINTSHLDLSYETIAESKELNEARPPIDYSQGPNKFSPLTDSHVLPDLPELDGFNQRESNDFEQQSSWIQNLSKETSLGASASAIQSPAPKWHDKQANDALLKRPSPGNRRPPSRSRPPSPILEEVVIPVKRDRTDPPDVTHASTRRNSYPYSAGRYGFGSRSATTVACAETGCEQSGHELIPDVSSPTLRGRGETICPDCDRPERPRPTSSRSESTRPMTSPARRARQLFPTKPSDHLAQQTVLPVPRRLSGKGKEKQKQEELGTITRFPSLHNIRIKPDPTPVPAIPRWSSGRYAIPPRLTSSRAPGKPSIPRITTAPSNSHPGLSSPRSIRSTPLHEQRYMIPSSPTSRTEHGMSPITLPQTGVTATDDSNTRTDGVKSVGRDSIGSRSEQQPFQKVTSPQPRYPVVLKANGSKVSLALPETNENPARPPSPIFGSPSHLEMAPDEGNERLLERLLDGLNAVERQLLYRGRRPTSRAIRRSNSSKIDLIASQSVVWRHRTAANRPRWTGSLRRWTTSGAIEREVDYDLEKRPTSAMSNLQVRVLTLDRDGKFSTSVIDSPAQDCADEQSRANGEV